MCLGKKNAERRTQNVERRNVVRPPSSFFVLRSAFCVLLLLTFACRQKMANQPRYDPYESSDFFTDGMASRPRIAGTVARGELSVDPFLETGKIGNAFADGFPMSVDRQLVDRGQERFDIYCQQCHGRVGDGNGMIPARGLRRPPSFHTDRLRAATTGHYFDVITNGLGAMPPYRTMIPARDRWAIIAYVRALQLSQNATVADVPPDQRVILSEAKDPRHPGNASPSPGRTTPTTTGGQH
jgi:mono/diheme cytochrome c family protein